MTIKSHNNGEWAVLSEDRAFLDALGDAMDEIGAGDLFDSLDVAAIYKREQEEFALQMEAGVAMPRHGPTMILGQHTELLPSGVKIGWYLTVAPTNWGMAVYWNVGVISGTGHTIPTASIRNRDYVLDMLRAACAA